MDNKDKKTPLLVQMGIFAAILFVSQIISSLFPPTFVVPAPLIGMIILYLLLLTHVVKLSQVENLGDSLIGLISFLFIPSGIQLAGSLKLMQNEGVKDVVVTVFATIILLVVITYCGAFFIKIHRGLEKNMDKRRGQK